MLAALAGLRLLGARDLDAGRPDRTRRRPNGGRRARAGRAAATWRRCVVPAPQSRAADARPQRASPARRPGAPVGDRLRADREPQDDRPGDPGPTGVARAGPGDLDQERPADRHASPTAQTLGEVMVFDPALVTGLEPSRATPLWGAEPGAGRCGSRIGWPLPRAPASGGLQDADFWYAAAEKLLAPLLLRRRLQRPHDGVGACAGSTKGPKPTTPTSRSC